MNVLWTNSPAILSAAKVVGSNFAGRRTAMLPASSKNTHRIFFPGVPGDSKNVSYAIWLICPTFADGVHSVIFGMRTREGSIPTIHSDSLDYPCPAHFQPGTSGL